MRQNRSIAACSIVLLAACSGAGNAEPVGHLRSAQLTEAGRPLYVTHAFSSEIARLTIHPDGRLTPGPLTDTQPTPRGMVFHPTGRRAYVGNARHVSVYAVGEDGELSELEPPTPLDVPEGQVTFGSALAPNGKTLYISAPQVNRLFSLRVRDDGTLAGVIDTTTLEQAKGIAVTPDGRFALVSQGVPLDEDADTLSTFALDADGIPSLVGNVKIGASGAATAITPDGRFVYVACQVSDEVRGFSIGSDGGLAPLVPSSVPAPDFPEGMAISPDGRQLYVPTVLTPHVRVFSIADDGALAELRDSPFPTGTGPIGVAPTPDGAFVFVSNIGGPNVVNPFPGSVTSFAVGADGVLSLLELETLTGGDSPAFQSAAISTNQGPTARFRVRARPAGTASTFDASASTDADGFVARHDWDFGDGTLLQDGGARPSHVYDRPGTFQVSLTVTDNEGCSERFVYTGQSAYCNGSLAATEHIEIEIAPPAR